MLTVGNIDYPNTWEEIIADPNLLPVWEEFCKEAAFKDSQGLGMALRKPYDPKEVYDRYIAADAPYTVNVPDTEFALAKLLAGNNDWNSKHWPAVFASIAESVRSLLYANIDKFFTHQVFKDHHVANGGNALDRLGASSDEDAATDDTRVERLFGRSAVVPLQKAAAQYEKEGESLRTLTLVKRAMAAAELQFQPHQVIPILLANGVWKPNAAAGTSAVSIAKRFFDGDIYAGEEFIKQYNKVRNDEFKLWTLFADVIHKKGWKITAGLNPVRELNTFRKQGALGPGAEPSDPNLPPPNYGLGDLKDYRTFVGYVEDARGNDQQKYRLALEDLKEAMVKGGDCHPELLMEDLEASVDLFLKSETADNNDGDSIPPPPPPDDEDDNDTDYPPPFPPPSGNDGIDPPPPPADDNGQGAAPAQDEDNSDSESDFTVATPPPIDMSNFQPPPPSNNGGEDFTPPPPPPNDPDEGMGSPPSTPPPADEDGAGSQAPNGGANDAPNASQPNDEEDDPFPEPTQRRAPAARAPDPFPDDDKPQSQPIGADDPFPDDAPTGGLDFGDQTPGVDRADQAKRKKIGAYVKLRVNDMAKLIAGKNLNEAKDLAVKTAQEVERAGEEVAAKSLLSEAAKRAKKIRAPVVQPMLNMTHAKQADWKGFASVYTLNEEDAEFCREIAVSIIKKDSDSTVTLNSAKVLADKQKKDKGAKFKFKNKFHVVAAVKQLMQFKATKKKLAKPLKPADVPSEQEDAE